MTLDEIRREVEILLAEGHKRILLVAGEHPEHSGIDCIEKYIPSFCTACYRTGRTGEKFMDLAKNGEIRRMCEPNALLSLKEYLLDYASAKLQKSVCEFWAVV